MAVPLVCLRVPLRLFQTSRLLKSNYVTLRHMSAAISRSCPSYLTRPGDVTLRYMSAAIGRRCWRYYDVTVRSMSSDRKSYDKRTTRNYVIGFGVLVCAISYAAVPMYRVFCQAFSYGGTTQGVDDDRVCSLKRVEDRTLKIRFNADTSSSMTWNFKPLQRQIMLKPGETALAFYTATNPTDKPIDGVATYNVIPFEAGAYFNKIQCFCFEEQRLNAGEQVDMPVFFYIDPDFCDDPAMLKVSEIILSYTFFESKPGFTLPVPSYARTATA